ncbi:tetratricopeptide repeat protein [Hymenobacter terrestris]|uniref:Tetratricopeptide repeat protein n=1 Tax=Hymenobacter terrestris TaxID=2748310 RepID=A0ABX2Q3Z7_9BACT|nr:hypothetical protein [Hymenobacter terrestris]NVO84492.1 hypothetical protein [Hymenobacter terrestris]
MPKFLEPVQTLYEAALAHEDAYDWGAAAACYEEAVTLVTDSPELWARYARLLNREGVRNKDGHIDLSAAAEATRCAATTADELYWRGIGAYLTDGGGDSQRDLAASLALNPTHADAWYYYAEALEHPAAYFSGSDYDELAEGQAHRLAAYDQALALDPGNSEYLIGRADFHLAHDRLADALVDLDTVLEQHPANKYAMQLRAIIRVLQYDFRGALRDFAAGGTLSGNWRNSGVGLHIRYPNEQLPSPAARWAEALAAFEQTGIREPTTATYLSERAAYFLRHGAPNRALDDALAIVGRQPQKPAHRELLVSCLLAQPTPDLGALLAEYEWLAARPIPALSRKKSGFSENAPEVARCLWNQAFYRHQAAWVMYRLGRPKESLAYFEAACSFAFTQEPYSVEREKHFTWYPANPDEPDTLPCGPRRSVEVGVANGTQFVADVNGLLPACNLQYFSRKSPDMEYLRWQLAQQLKQEYATDGVLSAVGEWLCAAAWQLAGPPLGEACEACLKLQLPTGHWFRKAREANEFAVARELCLTGLAQLPAYAPEFRLLQQALLRAELRNTKGRPGATPANIEAALERYDAGLAALRDKS